MTRRCLSALAILLFLVLSTAAFADSTTYVYHGDNYSFVYGSGGYSTSQGLNGYITLANPLSPGSLNLLLANTVFSFNDGVNTINSSNATSGFFALHVNTFGQITSWAFGLDSTISSLGSCKGCLLSGDVAYSNLTNSGGLASTGYWVSTKSVPEASTVLMLGMTAMGMFVMLRRRFAL